MTAALRRICLFEGILRTRSEVHISSGEREFRVQTVSRKTVKHGDTGIPYIPGSTLKGVMRAQVERACGLVQLSHGEPLTIAAANSAKWPVGARQVLQLFGCRPSGVSEWDAAIGPPRCSFNHAEPTVEWLSEMNRKGAPLTNRTNIAGTRRTLEDVVHRLELEVVPQGATFAFRLVWREYEGDDTLGMLVHGLRCLERRGIGFGVERGYGRIAFDTMTMDGVHVDLPGETPTSMRGVE
jgi:CRISPR-associated protein Csm3